MIESAREWQERHARETENFYRWLDLDEGLIPPTPPAPRLDAVFHLWPHENHIAAWREHRKPQDAHVTAYRKWRGRPVPVCCLFPDARIRRIWALARYREGLRKADIARMLGLGRERAGQIIARAKRETRVAARMIRRTASRPIDMGGPRDVWLTFFPSPDPRFDNMEPVSVS